MISALLLSLSGWMLLLMGMPQHQRDIFKRILPTLQRSALRIIATVLLILAALPFVTPHGLSIGIIMWLMMLTPTALATMMLFSFTANNTFFIAAIVIAGLGVSATFLQL